MKTIRERVVRLGCYAICRKSDSLKKLMESVLKMAPIMVRI